MLGEHAKPPIPMDRVIAHELHIMGSHGMQAFRYADMLAMVEKGTLAAAKTGVERIALDEAPAALMAMDRFDSLGISVIDRF